MDLSPTSTTVVAVDVIVQAQRAQAAGLIRVNDLPLWWMGDLSRKPQEFATLHYCNRGRDEADLLGKYCTNNSRITVVTREGHIYWGSTHTSSEVRELRRDFCGEYGIESSGVVGVFASNGDEFLNDHLVQRLANPFGEPVKGYTVHF